MGVCCIISKNPRKGLFGKVWVPGVGSETVYLQNWRLRLDPIAIFGNLPVQVARGVQPMFPYAGGSSIILQPNS